MFDELGKAETGERIHLGEVSGKNEAWLRDTLFDNPEIIPLTDVDSTFGPLIPLCKELRTEAGRIDAVFINERGRLTIVECKLWKNPGARREVVAQTLDYVAAISLWSYADLQREVSAAIGRQGNLPFELAQKASNATLREIDFVDAVSRSLREGRFLVLIAGDGIREGIRSLTELVNRSATKAFSFGLIEIALYRFDQGRIAIQPRVLLESEVIERKVTIVNLKDGSNSIVLEDDFEKQEVAPQSRSGSKEHLKEWWQPVLRMKFDDPEQESPFWSGSSNNAVLNTPFPGVQIKAYAMVNGSRIGVFISGPRWADLAMIQKYLKRERQALTEELPEGTEIRIGSDPRIGINESELKSDIDKYNWLKKTLNTFVNVMRPRLRKWYEETRE